MQRCSYSNLGQGRAAARGTGNPSASQRLGRLLDLKRLDELIKEAWYSVRQFSVGDFGRVSLSDLESAPIDQVNSVGGEKLVQHFYRLRAFQAPFCAVAYTHRGATLRTHALAAGFVPGPRRGFGSGGGSRRSLSFLTTA